MKNFCEIALHEMQMFPSTGSDSKIETQSDTHLCESEESFRLQAALSIHLKSLLL